MRTQRLPLYHRYHAASRREPAARVTTATVDQLAMQIRRLVRATGRRLWLVADENTLAAAGGVAEQVDPAFRTIFPGAPALVPEIEHAEAIAEQAHDAGAAAMVVIGSGTLTDLAKYASKQASLPLVSVPSAASVDAYTSAKSALRIDGYHRTPLARVPDVVIACPQIVARAPEPMGYAGIGDLIAKLVARIDWQVASTVTGEPFSERESAWSARAARTALARFRREGLQASAVTSLDALLVTGRAMVLAGSSRPAASSEHTFAHLWEVARPGAAELHGALVASASRIVLDVYRWIVERLDRGTGIPSSLADRANAAYDAEQSWQDRVPPEMQPYLGKMREESAGRRLSPEKLRLRIERITERRAEIARLSGNLLDEIARALGVLEQRAGEQAFPPIPPEWRTRALEWVRYLRNRYSLFDLAWELGWEDELLARFG